MLPGFACASFTKSASVCAATDGCTTSTFGNMTAIVIGARSRTGSYGSFAMRCGATDSDPTEASSSVYPSGCERATISVFDAAVMLGDTVTESTRTFGQRPFRLERHLDRLYKSLKVTRIDPGLSRDELLGVTLAVLEANRRHMAPEDDCWIVHNISRGRSVAGADPTRQRGQATVISGRPSRCAMCCTKRVLPQPVGPFSITGIRL